jgi:hypothetical protein
MRYHRELGENELRYTFQELELPRPQLSHEQLLLLWTSDALPHDQV